MEKNANLHYVKIGNAIVIQINTFLYSNFFYIV